jgi:hypothetical protein
MKYKSGNYEIGDYMEDLDGSVEGCVLVEMLDVNVGIYENKNGKFMIENYNGGDEEFIYKVI